MMSLPLSLGLDLGGTQLKAVVLNAKGELIEQTQEETPRGREVSEVLEQLTDLSQRLIRQYPDINQVGLGAPGLVDLNRRIVRIAPNFPTWENVPLGDLLGERLQLPVLLENDVNCFGIAEHRWGAGRGFHHLLALAVGTGIGGAIILNNQLYRGSSGAAAELGHLSVDLWGPKCGCGNRGCVERYLGEKWYTLAAQSELGEVSSPAEVSQLAQNGDERAQRFIHGRGEILGVACTTLIHIIDPEAIIIGGGIAQAGEPFFAGVRHAIAERAYPILAQKVRILPAQLGTISGARGAAIIHQYA